jgi:SulP family sulfate permease
LTVSVVELPQAMAYALIAGVPPQYGIYTSVIQGVLGALFSSSQHLRSGPTNTQSLLVASAVARFAQPAGDPSIYLQLVFALTVLKGLMQLALAAAGMGAMVRFVSRSVIVGVAAGVGVLIIVNQIPNLLGLAPASVATSGAPAWPGAIGAVQRMWPHFTSANTTALWTGIACIAVMLAMRAISPMLPGALAAIVLSAIAVALLGIAPDTRLPLVGELPSGLPAFHIPQISWSEAEALLGGALALALQGMIETIAITKSLAAKTGERVNADQEFYAQGLTNTIAGFFQCIPGSGSFTRSALDHAAGAMTRVAAVFNALFVAAIFLLFGGLARYIPMAALGAVLLVIAVRLIDFRYIARLLATSRADAAVCIATFFATVVLPLEYAIFIGIFLSLGMYIRTASRLHIAEMVQAPGGAGTFVEQPILDRATGDRQVVFLQVEGDLFFGVADELQERLTQFLHSHGVRVVILRLKRTHSIDSTVLYELECFARHLQARGGHLLLCGIRPEIMITLRGYGLDKIIGPENLFPAGPGVAGPGVFSSAKQALNRARELVSGSIDDAHIDVREEELTYDI